MGQSGYKSAHSMWLGISDSRHFSHHGKVMVNQELITLVITMTITQY